MNVNIKAAFFMSRRQAAKWSRRAEGKIINIASMLSFQGGIRVPSYTASKSGIARNKRASANEWRRKGINSNALRRVIWRPTTRRVARRRRPQPDILGPIPAGRWGVPADFGRDRGFPGQLSIGLCERCGDSCQWRLACTLNCCSAGRKASVCANYIATW